MEQTIEKTEPRNRSGSEKRRRAGIIGFRATLSERAELEAAAERAGLSLSSYVRAATLKAPKMRATRRPSIEVQTITRLQGAMNKVGSNVHQLLRRVNFGETPEAREYREALTGYREVIAAILAALGRGPGKG